MIANLQCRVIPARTGVQYWGRSVKTCRFEAAQAWDVRIELENSPDVMLRKPNSLAIYLTISVDREIPLNGIQTVPQIAYEIFTDVGRCFQSITCELR